MFELRKDEALVLNRDVPGSIPVRVNNICLDGTQFIVVSVLDCRVYDRNALHWQCWQLRRFRIQFGIIVCATGPTLFVKEIEIMIDTTLRAITFGKRLINYCIMKTQQLKSHFSNFLTYNMNDSKSKYTTRNLPVKQLARSDPG